MSKIKLRDHLRRVGQMNRVLLGDVGNALESLRQSYDLYVAEPSEDSQLVFDYHLKTTIRCFLGGVDATSYCLRQAVLDCAAKHGVRLEPSQRKALKKVRNPRASLKMGYHFFATLVGLEMTLDEDSSGWRAFCNLVETRNGFTHPKDIRDLFATKHLGSLQPALEWYPLTLTRLFHEVGMQVGVRADRELQDVESELIDMPVSIDEVFDAEFFRLLAEDAGRSIGYLTLCSRKLEGETSLAMKEARLRSEGLVLDADSQYTFRNLVRTLFSNLEGFNNLFRIELEKAASRSELHLTTSDREAMSCGGEVEERVEATARVWSREVGYGMLPATRGEAWKAVEQARGIRNRITHPKRISDLRIDLDRGEIILAAVGWFIDEIMSASYIDEDKWVSKLKQVD